MPKHNLNPIYTQDEKRPLCATFSADLTPSAQCLPPWNVCVFTLTCSSCGSRGGGTRTKNFLQHTLVCSLTENTQLWHMPLSHLNMHTKKINILLHYTNIFQVHQSELVTNLVESFKPKDALPLSQTLAYDCCISPPKGRQTELSKLSWCSPLLIRHK